MVAFEKRYHRMSSDRGFVDFRELDPGIQKKKLNRSKVATHQLARANSIHDIILVSKN